MRQDVGPSAPHVSVDNICSAGVKSPGSIGIGNNSVTRSQGGIEQ